MDKLKECFKHLNEAREALYDFVPDETEDMEYFKLRNILAITNIMKTIAERTGEQVCTAGYLKSLRSARVVSSRRLQLTVKTIDLGLYAYIAALRCVRKLSGRLQNSGTGAVLFRRSGIILIMIRRREGLLLHQVGLTNQARVV